MSNPSTPTTRPQSIRIGDLDLAICKPPDFDALLDAAAQQTPNDVDAIPYYAALWPSAHALASVLWEQRDALAGRRVLELGCGLGLPSIVAARLGASVTATDFHPDAGAWCEANAAANHVALTFAACDWSAPPDWPPFDLVIGSDLIYERRHIPALSACIEKLCATNGVVLIADPGRDGLAQFTAAMQAGGWPCELIPKGEIYVLAFRRAGGRQRQPPTSPRSRTLFSRGRESGLPQA